MKGLWALLALLILAALAEPSPGRTAVVDGYCKGIRLSGRVKVVPAFGDLRGQVVKSAPDLRVKAVTWR